MSTPTTMTNTICLTCTHQKEQHRRVEGKPRAECLEPECACTMYLAQNRILDVATEQKVKYCIPLWLRDEQVKAAIARPGLKRLEPYPPDETRAEPIACVCFGPSLNETWEEIRDFKYVMTCSGAHKFLVERGIIPTWHVDLDPRPHKVQLIGQPQHETEYLIASTCHPNMFELLKDYNVTLWHIFSDTEEAKRILPYGEWALTGGCSVGLRTLGLARFLGFTDIHVFGMDGNDGATGKHAAAHPNQPPERFKVEFGGRTWWTTPAMLQPAKDTEHELDQLPDVDATFHGDGLCQAMMKNYKRKPPASPALLAFQKERLITEDFRELNAKLHRDNMAYGVGGGRHAKVVLALVESLKTTSILDYGCGKGYLAKELAFPIWEYDPAVPGKEAEPRPADIVTCTDVLEHIEPECLKYVLAHLSTLSKRVMYAVIHLGPASKCYADGRNTHLIQKSKAWWLERVGQFFKVNQTWDVGEKELHVLGTPRTEGTKQNAFVPGRGSVRIKSMKAKT